MIRRVHCYYEINSCWGGCESASTNFFITKNNIEQHSYAIGYCAACSKTLKLRQSARHWLSNTTYTEVPYGEAVVFQIMSG